VPTGKLGIEPIVYIESSVGATSTNVLAGGLY